MNINAGKILTKLAGAATAGLVLYDSHKVGTMTSQQEIKRGIGDRLPDSYIASRRQNSKSFVTSNLKDKLFREQVNFGVPDKINSVIGYLKGGFDQLASNIVPAVLATGALVKNKFSKAFGVGLGVYAAYYIISNVLNVGRIKYFKD